MVVGLVLCALYLESLGGQGVDCASTAGWQWQFIFTRVCPLPFCCRRDPLVLLTTEVEDRSAALGRVRSRFWVHLMRLSTSATMTTTAHSADCKLNIKDIVTAFRNDPITSVSYEARLAWLTDRFASPASVFAMNQFTEVANEMFKQGQDFCTKESAIKRRLAELQAYNADMLEHPGIIELKAALGTLQHVNAAWRNILFSIVHDIDCIKYLINPPEDTVQPLRSDLPEYCTGFKPMYEEWD